MYQIKSKFFYDDKLTTIKNGTLSIKPKSILQTRVTILGNRFLREYLIKWSISHKKTLRKKAKKFIQTLS